MAKRLDIRKIFEILLILSMVATVAFAFYQSSLPKQVSAETSDKVGTIVGEIIEEIFPPETPVGDFVQVNIRKIAHFVEFALLGTEAALYIFFFKNKLVYTLASYPAALFIALLDETIQILSERGPMIADVWLDFSGFLTLSLITYGVLYLGKFVSHSIKNKVKNNGKNN